MSDDDTTLEHCPTCGKLGCVGYCEPDDYPDPDALLQRWAPCCCCGLNDVCVSEGYDTCAECLAKQ